MHAHSMHMDMDMGACKMHNPAACHSRVSPPPLATPVCLARPREGGARVWVIGSFHMCSSRARVAFWYISHHTAMNAFSSQSVSCLVSGGWVIVHSLSAYPVAIIAFGHSATGLVVVSRRACGTCRSIVVAGGFLCSAPV